MPMLDQLYKSIAHKIHGPLHVAALLVDYDWTISPVWFSLSDYGHCCSDLEPVLILLITLKSLYLFCDENFCFYCFGAFYL